MTKSAKLASALLLANLGLVPGIAPAFAGDEASIRVQPLSAISLNVGSKRAIGYFSNDDRTCNLTLMLADGYSEGGVQSEPVRVALKVRPNAAARVETFENKALSFSCAADATSMTIQPVERVAYNAAAR